MNIVKIGKSHLDTGMNCQDATGNIDDFLKIVCDGCSEGKHSEVGAKLFVDRVICEYDYYKEYIESLGKNFVEVDNIFRLIIEKSMRTLVTIIGTNPKKLKDYLSFTIFIVYKVGGTYSVYYCGDGYIFIDVPSDDNIKFIKIDNGEYPNYYIYNYVSSKYLKAHIQPTIIEYKRINSEFNVGIASDGIRFAVDRPDDDSFKRQFIKILRSGKDIKMKLFINKHQNIFQDDVSIVF